MTLASSPPIVVGVSGFARTPFEPLADIFGRLIGAQGSGGGALAIYLRNELVVDLVGGAYRGNSLQAIFSITKAVAAIAAAMAHEEGLLDLDAPLGDHWPAFRRPSTASITTRMVLAHRSGVASLDRRLSFAELCAGAADEAVEAQEPYWEPGTRHGYHAFTYGSLLDGIFRRSVGSTVGAFVAEQMARPLGLDLWIGTPASELPRVERIAYRARLFTPGRAEFLSRCGIPAGTTAQLAQVMDIYNDPAFLQLCLPSSSGVAGARDLARLFAATLDAVDGVRLLTPDVRRRMVAPLSRGRDEVLGITTQFGSGVQLPFPQFPLLGPGSFGHEAAGGSAAFADSDFGVSVGFTTNVHPSMSGASEGFLALLPAIRHCLTAEATVI